MSRTAKKLVSVLATSLSTTRASMEDTSLLLERVPCIYYLVQFKKNEVQALINSGSEVNAINPAYAKKLGLCVRQTDVWAQKIEGSHLDSFGMVIAGFSLQDKLKKVWFLQETFLAANTRIEVVQRMSFLTLRNANIRFAKWELVWWTYSVTYDPKGRDHW